MKVYAVYNIKGGVGKTASTVNLAYLSAKSGLRTLICDLDPQGSTTYYFRIRANKKHNSKKLIKGGKKLDKQIKATDFANLDLLPADFSYRNLDIKLDNKERTRLRKSLNKFKGEYDTLFLDCPPNITLLSENIFEASDFIIMPVIPTTLSILTYKKTKEFFKENNYNQRKIIPFFSMLEIRKNMHKDYYSLYAIEKKKFLKSYIPYNVDIEKMGITREPVIAFAPDSKATQAYYRLWEEINKFKG